VSRLFRDLWAGLLLVNASRPTPRRIYALWLVVPLAIVARLLRHAPMSSMAIGGLGMSVAITLWLSVIYGRIESRSWEDPAGDNHLLHLQLGGWRRGLNRISR
jgi:hypothetical protein